MDGVTVKPQWISYTGSEVDDWQGGTARFSNGDLANAVASFKADGTSSVQVQRINSSGNVLWSVNLDADYAPSVGSILVGKDNNVYVTGGTKKGATGESGKNDSDVFATSLSAEGDLLWYKNYGIGIHEIGAAGVFDKSGDLILNGRISEVNDAYAFIKDVASFYGAEFSGGWRGFQLKVDSEDGSVVKAYTTGSYNSGGEIIAADESRDTVFVGGYTFGAVNGINTIGNGDPAGANKYLIARDESTGEVLWTRMENWIRSNVVVQESEDAIYFVDKGVLEKVKGSTGETLWSEPVENTYYVLSPALKGGILMSQSANAGELVIKHVDASGLEVATQSVTSQGELYLTSLAERADGSLIISGTTSGDINVGQDVTVLNSRKAGKDAFVMQVDSSFSDPAIPTYAITHTPTPSVAEGATLTTNVATTGVAKDTTVYWSATGTGIDADDFTGGAQELTGQATVGADGKFSFTHSIKNDSKTEGNETLQVNLYSDSARTQKVGDTASTTITDSSKTPPTYSVTHSPSGTVEEGATLTTTLQTTGVDEGATIYWTADGENIDEDDFSSGELSGEGTVGADGKVTISHTLENDKTTEGNETLEFAFYSDEDHQTPVTRRSTVTVSDTSKTPPTYKITQSNTVNEGGTLNTTVRTTDLAPGTKVFWTADGTGIDDKDFSAGALSGEGIVGADGTFTFSHTLAYDNKTEGNEKLDIKLYSDSTHRTQVGETASTTIVDTSRNSVIVTKQEGDAYAGINDDLPRGQSNVVGIRTKNLNVNGNGEFNSDVDSTSTAVATTENGNASAHVRQSLLGISISDSSRIGGDAKFTSILTHDSDNSASAVNGTADVQDRINSVSVDASNLNVHGKSNFGSYMSVRSQNSADTTQTNDENISTNASAILNRNQLLGEPNIVGMRFDNVNLGKGVFNSQVDNTSDMSANSIRGDASTFSNNSVLGIGFNGASKITGDAQVTSLLTQRSFSDAQSVHGTAITEDHHSVIGVEAHDLTVTGNATFSSTVVVRALSNSGT
jgi:hypothetical protein